MCADLHITITCTRTAKSADRPSLCFWLLVMWDVQIADFGIPKRNRKPHNCLC